MSGSLLHAEGLAKRYGPVPALSDVDLTLRRGEIVALAGENGSGKSTLARIIAGMVRPDAGVVTVEGRALRPADPRAALRHGISLVTQELTCVAPMSVAENVLLPRLARPVSVVRRGRLVDDARPYLRRAGLGHVDPRAPVAALRQGERELVEVAKALATEPRLLILDEATTRLSDPERLFTLVEALAADGVATVLITHRLREIRRLAHRAVVLRDGRVVDDLARDELTDERISSAMVGRPLDDLYAKPHVPIGDPVLTVDGVRPAGAAGAVSLTVRRGEIVGLAGLVGAGRSELLEAVVGARPRTAGTVSVGGTAVPAGSPTRARDAGIGFVPEDRRAQGLHLGGSIADNLAVGSLRAWRRTDRRGRDQRARHAVRTFAIRCAGIEAPVATLSGGNQQKVLLAKALAHDPAVLLLDEPTRGVDIGAKQEIYRIVADLVAGGVAVLLASSDLLELIGLCDRILVLHEGAVTGELSRAEATEDRIALLAAGGGVTVP